MEKIEATKVFTPTTPAKYAFVERVALNKNLVDALRTPGKQVVVYGPSGSGKTTLLVNKLQQLYPDHITSRCTISTTFESLLMGAFDSLDIYYSSSASIRRSKSVSVKLAKDYFGIKSSIELLKSVESTTDFSRFLPPQLTPQRLAEFCGAAGCCWVLEDFHKISIQEKTKLSQIMKVFTDTASEYPGVKIIAIGAVNSAREVIQYDPEMRNRVAEIAVPLMSKDELLAIMNKGKEVLNIDFVEFKDKIASYASGLAAVCHQICLNVCFEAELYQTADSLKIVNDNQFTGALKRYLADSSDTVKAVFDMALRQKRARRFDNTKIILSALTLTGEKGGTYAEIMVLIKKKVPDYPAGNLTTYLAELQTSLRGELIRYDSTSGKYFFSDPIYLVYAKLTLAPPKSTETLFSALGISKDLFDVLGLTLKTILGEKR